MQELKIFENQDFGQVRTVTEDNKIYFCGSDVAKALGYVNPNKAIKDHCKGVTKRDTPTYGGIQEMSFIPEGDIYRLIVRSKLPSAEKFEKWVFDEVLPSIRQTGTYNRPMTQTELIAAQAQILVEMERKVNDTSDKLDRALDVIAKPVVSDSWRDSTNRIINSICKDNNLSYSSFRRTLYTELEQIAKCDLNARKRNLHTRLKASGSTSEQCRAVTKIDVIARDDKLRLIFDGIVKRHQVSYVR